MTIAMTLSVVIEPDETGMFVAECPAIPGCISQGVTLREAMDNIREAIAGCIESRLALELPLNV
jgi:predicted RNase H-like HicB family nuclease